MRKDRDFEDQDLKEEFLRLKQQDASRVTPSFEDVLNEESKAGHLSWYLAAGFFSVLLVAGFWLFSPNEKKEDVQSMQIILSYEEPDEEEGLEIEGMDQWQSETDILITGL